MKAGNCRHFTGLMESACKVGVVYASVRDESARPFRIPCLTVSWRNKKEPCATTCAKFEAFTADDEAAWMKEVNESASRVFVTRNAITSVLGKWKNGGGDASGAMVCHVCRTGTLRYSRSGYNGHIHGACSTDGCVRWME